MLILNINAELVEKRGDCLYPVDQSEYNIKDNFLIGLRGDSIDEIRGKLQSITENNQMPKL